MLKKLYGNKVIFFILSVLLLTGCNNFNKIVKSSDYEFKYKKALEYYQDEDYSHASALLEKLVTIYRGTSSADDVYFYYAKSLFEQKDYIMACHWFRTLLDEFSESEHAEESQFMVGSCYYLQSPSPRLDQSPTYKSIDAFHLFVNLYPGSKWKAKAESYINELQNKLVYKSYLTGKLYYDFGNYKAAVIALSNSLKDYPGTKYREDLMFMLLKAKYLLATNSVEAKKKQRLSNALDEYFAFVDEFPQSENKKEVDNYYKILAKLLNYKSEDKLDTK